MYATQEEFDALVRAYNKEVERVARNAPQLSAVGLDRELASLREMFDFVIRTHNANRVSFQLPIRLATEIDDAAARGLI